MLESLKNPASTKLESTSEPPEVEIGIDLFPSSKVALPPVSRMLQGTVIESTPKAVGFTKPVEQLTSGLKSAFDLLLNDQGDFADSINFGARLADVASLCGETDVAYSLSHHLAEQNKDRQDLAYKFGQIAFESDDIDVAERVWHRLATNGHALSCLRMAELAIRRADIPDASAWLHKAMESDATDWRVLAFAGILALIVGDGPQAVRFFRGALEERPRSVRLHYNLALAHTISGNSRNALRAVRRAVGLNPLRKSTLLIWADLSVHNQKGFGNVTRALSRYISYFPDDKSTRETLAFLWHQWGDDIQATRILSEARLRFEDPIILNNLGVLSLRKRNVPAAIGQFKQAIFLATRSTEPANKRIIAIATANLADAFLTANTYKLAQELCEAYCKNISQELLVSEQPYSRIANSLTLAWLNNNNAKHAISTAQKWIKYPEVDTDLQMSLLELLICYYTLTVFEPEVAYNYAAKAFDLQEAKSPRDLNRWNIALNNLAFSTIELGNIEEAKTHIVRLRNDIASGAHYVSATRGLLAFRLGQVEKGERLYSKAISLADDRSRKSLLRQKLNWELGSYWASVGENRRAQYFLNKVLRNKVYGAWVLPYLRIQAAQLLEEL